MGEVEPTTVQTRPWPLAGHETDCLFSIDLFATASTVPADSRGIVVTFDTGLDTRVKRSWQGRDLGHAETFERKRNCDRFKQ